MKPWTLGLILVATSGCTAIVDGAIQDAVDGGGDECATANDGTPCSGGRVCIDRVCSIGECGDQVVDSTNEECDDGNDTALDGCENDCHYTCESASDCDDGSACNGAETCGGDHTCSAGTPLGDGADCTRSTGDPGVCRGVDCVVPGCGDGTVVAGEECDHGPDVADDDCKPDCTFTCEADDECNDGSVCTGTETCNVTDHLCVAGTEMTCDDGSGCTSNECDPVMGCVYPLIDGDGDGHASQELGACGDDCNDARDDVSPSSVELCGDALDSDCDGNVNPGSTPVWYRDCDDDGYAVLGAVTMTSCSEPPGVSGCTAWTTRVPIAGDRSTYDCNDGNATVRPSQTGWFTSAITGVSTSVDFDYDCNAVEEKRYPSPYSAGSCLEIRGGGGCLGTAGWVTSSSTTSNLVPTSAPSCGNDGRYTYCREYFYFCAFPPCTGPSSYCSRTIVDRTEECH